MWVLLFVMHVSLDTINIIDVLPSTTAVHLSLMRQRPIPTQTTFHGVIKGTPQGDNGRQVCDLHFIFFNSDFDKENKHFPAFLCRRKKYLSGFIEIEMMEEWWHGSNLSHHNLRASISAFSLPFLAHFSSPHLFAPSHHCATWCSSIVKASKTLPPTKPAA